jgi:hypothetical protein
MSYTSSINFYVIEINIPIIIKTAKSTKESSEPTIC